MARWSRLLIVNAGQMVLILLRAAVSRLSEVYEGAIGREMSHILAMLFRSHAREKAMGIPSRK